MSETLIKNYDGRELSTDEMMKIHAILVKLGRPLVDMVQAGIEFHVIEEENNVESN